MVFRNIAGYLRTCTAFFLLLVFVLSGQPLLAKGSFKLSKNADFSTDDRVYSRDDVMYMKVTEKNIDFTDIKKKNFSIKPKADSNDDDNLKGQFDNNFNGSYTASLSLSSADPNVDDWEWRARIQDESDNEFEVRVDIKIIGGEGGGEGEEVEFTGTIDEISDDNIVVDMVEFVVSQSTEILDEDGNSILFTDLLVEQVVQIKGIRGTDGILRATRIKVEDTELGEDEIEVTSDVTEVGEDHITASGLTFQVTGSTEILDDADHPIALTEIKVGFVVQIRADVLGDETYLATKIKIEDRFNDELEITGRIEGIGDESLDVSGFEFVVTETTEILDNDNNPIDFGDLQVGIIVEIKAQVLLDGTLIAIRIKVEDNFQDEVEVTSTIETLDSDRLVVAGMTFVVTVGTEILDNASNLIPFTTLRAGFIVEIRGVVQPDGQIVASRIKIEDKITDEVEITGVIEHEDATSIMLLGKVFRITENTVVFDANDNMIPLDRLFIGQTVEVRGDLLVDDTLVAIRIKLEDSNLDQVKVVGPIDSFGENTIEIIGIHFFISDTTEIFDEQNNPIAFGELTTGQTVEVRAFGQPNGTRVTSKIKIEDIVLLSGVVEKVDLNGIQMLNKQVLFNSNTLILGKLNEFLSTEEVMKGQLVEVRAKAGSQTIIFGTKVKIQGGVTSVQPPPFQDDPKAPDNFAILQNYPNPFNPSTTVVFQIPAADLAALQTKLTIYNLLGQAVRTLVDEPLAAGTYQRQWDGTDDAGNPVASGIYLVRLRSEVVSVTRRMTLMR